MENIVCEIIETVIQYHLHPSLPNCSRFLPVSVIIFIMFFSSRKKIFLLALSTNCGALDTSLFLDITEMINTSFPSRVVEFQIASPCVFCL